MSSRKTLPFPASTPFKILSIYFIGLLLLMGFWRGIFLFSNLLQLQINDIPIYLKSFYVAVRLDAVVSSYLCLPVFLTILLPYIGWKSKIYRGLFFIFIVGVYMVHDCCKSYRSKWRAKLFNCFVFSWNLYSNNCIFYNFICCICY